MLKRSIFKFWPIAIIFTIVTLLFITNYQASTRLIGWDNLMTEFNLKVNFGRSIFAVWQEYQGLGLLGGMGHASDIIHDLGILFLSFVLPNDLVRYAWTFLMLFIGSTGAYFLIKNLIFKGDHHSEYKKQTLSLAGAVFYLLNLATMQTFYVPFEAFINHFAALPWLLLFTLQFFLKPNIKNAIIFIIVLLLASPHAYIPTLFVVYILSSLILIGTLIFIERQKFPLKSFVLTYFLIAISNAFWLLPFAYFTLTSSGVTLLAKINQMSTQTVFLQNMAFGNIQNVMLLKGFWFNNVDPNFLQKFTYMLPDWRNYLAIPLIQLIGYLLFAVIFIGVISSIKKGKIFIAFAALFVFAFTMLTTNTFPFSIINQIFRLFPLFGEAFRFPFTKFSILAALAYSIFFAVGIETISSFKFMKKINLYVLTLPFFILIVILTAPMFKGHLLYSKEKLIVPTQYFKTFDYFKNQDQNARIANLPQFTFWGWEFYNWGYGGSGFLWYGIKQPILDRAFDVWSKSSENYYWEMSHAIYSNNPSEFLNVINKYQIKFLMLDKNIVNPSSPQSLMTNEIQTLIKSLPEIKKDAQFDNIIIYKVDLKDKPNSFVFTNGITKSANKYSWGEYDKAYIDLGNYNASDINPDIFYPFRSLFSGKNQDNQEFNAKENNQYIEFSAKLPEFNSTRTLIAPKITELENNIFAQIIQTKANGVITISLSLESPQIYLQHKDSSGNSVKTKISGEKIIKPIFIVKQINDNAFYVNINGTNSFKVDPYVYSGLLGSSFLLTNQDNLIVLSNKQLKISQTFVLTKDNLNQEFSYKFINIPNIKNSEIIIDIPKINDSYQSFIYSASEKTIKDIKNCDNFNLGTIQANLISKNGKTLMNISSKNSTACFSSYSSTFQHDQGYIAFADSENIKGRPLHFWLLSENEKFAPIDTYLTNKAGLQTSTYIFSPQEQYGNSYSFHFDNAAITSDENINNFGQLRIYSFPYKYLTSLYLTNNKLTTLNQHLNLTVTHPNESSYNVYLNSKPKQDLTLILSQSFDSGWQAYKINKSGVFSFLGGVFPYFFGERLNKHILINNWENGWIINASFDNTSKSIAIVYLPQNLEYFGFILLIFLIIFLAFHALKKNIKHSPKLDESLKN